MLINDYIEVLKKISEKYDGKVDVEVSMACCLDGGTDYSFYPNFSLESKKRRKEYDDWTKQYDRYHPHRKAKYILTIDGTYPEDSGFFYNKKIKEDV